MANRTIIEPGTRCVTLTPSDSQDISATTAGGANGALPYARKLRITADGNVKFTTLGGDDVTYTGLTAGDVINWVSVKRLWATGTTATVEAIY